MIPTFTEKQKMFLESLANCNNGRNDLENMLKVLPTNDDEYWFDSDYGFIKAYPSKNGDEDVYIAEVVYSLIEENQGKKREFSVNAWDDLLEEYYEDIDVINTIFD